MPCLVRAWAVGLVGVLSLTCVACDAFYDEGARFADQVAVFAEKFRKVPETSEVFDYVPKHGVNQRIDVGIGKIQWCPKGPCYNQGAASVSVEHGKSGTGYRIGAAASVPAHLEVHKESGAVRVHMRKVHGVIEIFALE